MTVDKKTDAIIVREGICTGCNRPLAPNAMTNYCEACIEGAARGTQQEDEAALVRKELARRELCRRRLLPYIQRIKPDYKAGWFHKDLAARLERFTHRVEAGESPKLLINVPPRRGKLLADFIEVFTTRGWITHGELRVGDEVFGPDGAPTKVLEVHEPDVAAMEVEFTNGAVIQCHENHEWTVWNRSSRKWVTVETRWFVEPTTRGLTVGQPRSIWSGPKGKRGGRAMYQLPLVEPLQTTERSYLMPPYTLGAWLGDGSSKRPAITHAASDQAVIEGIVAEGYETVRVDTHATTGCLRTWFSGDGGYLAGRMTGELRLLGVWGNKHIPQQYKLGSIEQRLELLAGLIDTDGYLEPQTGRYSFSTCSKQLSDDVTDVIRSLGWRVCTCKRQPCLSSSGIQGKQVVYDLGFNPDRPIPCRLERKKSTRLAAKERVGIREVRSAEKPATGRCITVDREDGLYLVGRELVPTHNSEQASKGLVGWALGRNPNWGVIAATHSDKLATDNSRDVLDYVHHERSKTVFPDLELKKDAKGATGWRTTESGSYKPVGVGGGIAGYGADLLIIDDPHRDQDAYSPTIRESVWRWYRSSARTRLMPGGGEILIQTRWVMDDLTGRVIDEEGLLEEGGMWEQVLYPEEAIYDEYRTESGLIVHSPEPGATFLRSAGDVLHPERYDHKSNLPYKKDPVTWQALYQQNPIAGEVAQFSEPVLELCACNMEDIPDELSHYSTWDLAIGLKEINDYTVEMTGGVDKDDVLWIVDVQRERWDGYEIVEELIDSYSRFQQDVIGIEKTHLSMAIGPFLEKRLTERRAYSINVEDLQHGNKDKLQRARPIQARMRQGKVRIPVDAPWYAQLKKELLHFPGGKHDDMVDTLSYLGQLLDEMGTPFQKRKRPKKSWRDKVGKHVAGRKQKSWRTS